MTIKEILNEDMESNKIYVSEMWKGYHKEVAEEISKAKKLYNTKKILFFGATPDGRKELTIFNTIDGKYVIIKADYNSQVFHSKKLDKLDIKKETAGYYENKQLNKNKQRENAPVGLKDSYITLKQLDSFIRKNGGLDNTSLFISRTSGSIAYPVTDVLVNDSRKCIMFISKEGGHEIDVSDIEVNLFKFGDYTLQADDTGKLSKPVRVTNISMKKNKSSDIKKSVFLFTSPRA